MKKNRKIQIIGGGYLEVQEILDRFGEARLPIQAIQIAQHDTRVGEIHEFMGEPILVVNVDDLSDETYDAAILLSPITQWERLTREKVLGNTPLIDMAGHFTPGPNIPVLLPDLHSESIRSLPMIGVVPTGTAHAIASILKATGELASWRCITAFTVQGSARHGSRKAMDELFDQTRAILGFKDIECECFPRQLAFNVFHADPTDYRSSGIQAVARFVTSNPDLNVYTDHVWSGFFVGILGTCWLESSRTFDRNMIRERLSSINRFTWDDDWEGALSFVGCDEIFLREYDDRSETPSRLTLRFGMDNLRRGLSTTLVNLFNAVWGED